MHFHVCVVDGVFEAVAGNADDDADALATSPDVIFQPASAIDETAAAQVQATLRRRSCAPLLCPLCGGQMRIIAFITHSADIRQILEHTGVEPEPAHISPARGPPLWDDCDAQVGEGTQIEPDWDLASQPSPDFEVDQRVNW